MARIKGKRRRSRPGTCRKSAFGGLGRYFLSSILALFGLSLMAHAQADLSISVTDSVDPVTAGQTLTYTLNVGNGGTAATNVVATVTLPVGVTFMSTSGCAEDPVGYPNCSLGSLGAESLTEYTLTVLVDSSTTGMLVTDVSVTSDTTEFDPTDNMDSESTDVSTAADLVLDVVDSVDPVVAGENLTYTLTVSNNGPSDALGVMVQDTLGSGVSLLSTSGCSEDPMAVPNCTLGTVAAGGSAQYTITVAVDPGANGPINNSATVSSPTTEAAPGDEMAATATGVTSVSVLSLSKTDSVDPVNAGSSLTYTLTIGNAGPSDADFLELTDTLPAGVTFVSSSGCLEEVEDPPGVHNCLIDHVAAGGSTEYTITVAVDVTATGSLTNNAQIESTDPLVTATESTTVVPAADLQLSKSDSVDPVVAGANLTYTIVVTNNGPSEAINAVVTDSLPAGLTLVSSSGCSEDPIGAPTCSLGNIPAAGSKQYTLTVATDPDANGMFANAATVTSDSVEIMPGNESAFEVTNIVRAADLELGAVAQPDPVQTGSQLTYNFTVHNAGPSSSGNPVLSIVPDSSTQVVSNSSICTVSEGTITCGFDFLPVDATQNVQVVVEVPQGASGSVSLHAHVLGDESDPDEGDNEVELVTQVESSADLTLSLSSSPSPASLGQPLTLSAEVGNLGPIAATGVRLLWRVPDGITVESASVFPQGGCSFSSGLTSCSLGSVSVGDQVVVTLTANVTRTGVLLTDASLLASTSDPHPEGNDQRLVVQVGAAADLRVLKETDSVTVSAAAPLVYRLTVINDGPSAATAIVVEDSLPEGVAAQSDQLPENCGQETGGDEGASSHRVVCQIESLGSQSQTVILLPVGLSPDLRGDFTNHVAVQSEVFDPDDSNNTASVTNRAVGNGDLNGDGVVNTEDLSVLVRELNDGDGTLVEDVAGGEYAGNAAFDVNGDGLVDQADLEELVTLVLRK